MQQNRKIIKGSSGETSAAWKGDNLTYQGVHTWLRRNYGKASMCVKCNTKEAKMFQWANISGKYLRDINDFMELCPSCHKKFDFGDLCKRGHEFDEKNTRYRKKGAGRSCRKCFAILQKKYRQQKNGTI